MEILRSMLSVPGIRERFIEKAHAIPADIICFDLEDSIPWDNKPAARQLVARMLPKFPAKGRRLFVRVNELDSGLAEQDLDATVGPWLHGINMPKVHDVDVIWQVDAYLTFLEQTRGIPEGQIALIPWIETAEGIVNAPAICAASPRLIGAAMGGEDYATDLGVARTTDGEELRYPRAVMANACAAAGIVAIDTPTAEFQDMERFRLDLQIARGLGYRGKFCIHPTQVEEANQTFAPAEEEIAWARRVLEAYAEGKRQGIGAVALNGVMLDDPVVDRAEKLLAWTQQVAECDAALRA